MPRHPFGLLAVVKMKLQSRCVAFKATGLNWWINLLGVNEAYNLGDFVDRNSDFDYRCRI